MAKDFLDQLKDAEGQVNGIVQALTGKVDSRKMKPKTFIMKPQVWDTVEDAKKAADPQYKELMHRIKQFGESS